MVVEKMENTKDIREDLNTRRAPLAGMIVLWIWPWLALAPLRALVRLGLLLPTHAVFGQLETLRTISWRLLVAAGCGAIIGLERKDADRPAGLRSLTLVSAGYALYVLACMYSPEIIGRGDAARAAAQVCTGVGFIGAGVIAKGGGTRGDPVRGVTTACAVWVTAAIGVVAASGLHLLALYACGLTVTVLRVTRWYNMLLQSRFARAFEYMAEALPKRFSEPETTGNWRRSFNGKRDGAGK